MDYSNMKIKLMHFIHVCFLTFLSVLTISPLSYANELTEEEMERWLNSDDLNPPNYTKVEVNNGELFFLETKPNKKVHHHHNTFTIYKNSLNDGWIKLEQCHGNIDQVPRLQVVFNKKTIRDIRITKASDIGKSWVEGNSVQLENVEDKATLCIEAWSKALIKNTEGMFTLSNGPFMRKFLDGYFPIHVTIDVDYKDTNLQLVQIDPAAQDGFRITQTDKSINLDAWFEGRLKTNLTFMN